MRALYNNSGMLDCFIPELIPGCVTSPETDGVPRNLSGLADHGSESFADAARGSSDVPLQPPGGAQSAGMATTHRPAFPVGDFSDLRYVP